MYSQRAEEQQQSHPGERQRAEQGIEPAFVIGEYVAQQGLWYEQKGNRQQSIGRSNVNTPEISLTVHESGQRPVTDTPQAEQQQHDKHDADR